ncbi:hypothetical protein ES703_03494 [subsurface metagenome]
MINKSFTLIEIVVAIFLITVGTVGAFSLIQRTIAFTVISSSRLVAANLAQEGIEIIRNTRDTNWLSGNPWDQGLSSGGWQAVEMNGQATNFQRRITITPDTDVLGVQVEVSWQERLRAHQVTVQTKLHNWK